MHAISDHRDDHMHNIVMITIMLVDTVLLASYHEALHKIYIELVSLEVIAIGTPE